MTSAPTQKDMSGRATAPQMPGAPATSSASKNHADDHRVQTLHEAVEAARRFGLVRENY